MFLERDFRTLGGGAPISKSLRSACEIAERPALTLTNASQLR